MKVLDLFSGIGGFSLGLERAGFETVAFCEIDPYCRRVLRKNWPNTKVPIYEDIRKLSGEQIKRDVGRINVCVGGYPCQPFSTAGERRGAKDDRHLWPEMYRIVAECRPNWVIGENVAGHISMGLDEVLSDLETLGYTSRALVIPACAVDAYHRRDRVWIISHTASERLEESWRVRFAIGSTKEKDWQADHAVNGSRWPAEPGMARVAARVPNRVDRIKALGNSVIPALVERLGRAIIQAELDCAKNE